jgi:glycosyltransferase involved in cell wall biosynthesis
MRLFMTTDAVGGVWTYAVDLARNLADREVRTTLAVLGPPPTVSQAAHARVVPGLELLTTGLPLDWASDDRRAVRDAGERLAELADSRRADVVQVNSGPLAAHADFDAPLVVACHSCVATWWDAVRRGPLPADFGWRTELAARAYERADALIAPSVAFGKATAARYDLRRAPVTVKNGRRPLVRAPRAETTDAFVFTAGRLWDEGKNLAALDRAAPRLHAPVVAAGPVEAPHGGRIRFEHLGAPGALGPVQMAQLLAERPVFVSTALYEPFGLSVLEAAQAGCPLVLSDIPTFRELWAGAADFVDPADEAALASSINRLLADADLRQARGAAARRRARLYTAEAMAQATLGVYRAVTSPAAAATGAELGREAAA